MIILLTEQQLQHLHERKTDLKDLKNLNRITDYLQDNFEKIWSNPSKVYIDSNPHYIEYLVKLPTTENNFEQFKFVVEHNFKIAKRAEAQYEGRKIPTIRIFTHYGNLNDYDTETGFVKAVKSYIYSNAKIIETIVHELQHHYQTVHKKTPQPKTFYDKETARIQLSKKERQLNNLNKTLSPKLQKEKEKLLDDYFKDGHELDAFFKQAAITTTTFIYLDFEDSFKQWESEKQYLTKSPEELISEIFYIGDGERQYFISSIFERLGHSKLKRTPKYKKYFLKRIAQLYYTIREELLEKIKTLYK